MTAKEALAVVASTVEANAAMLGEPPSIKAVITPDGQIALERLAFPGVVARLLGDPDEAVERAHRAFLKAGVKVFGTAS